MKWQHYLTSVCFAFLGLFAGSFIINQNSASAVSDISVSYNSFNSGDDIFPNCDSDCFQSYNYLIVQTIDGNFTSIDSRTSFVIAYIYDTVNQNGYQRFSFTRSTYANYYTLLHPQDSSNFGSLRFSSMLSNSDTTYVFTLTESLGSPVPSGSLSITANGTYDVTDYAEAVVEVPNTETIIQGDYHDDLVSINNSIMVCAGVCLVLYFFYCIYRMFIKTGGK